MTDNAPQPRIRHVPRERDDDVLDVAPPPGWTCEPASCRLERPENSGGTIYLHARTAPGM